MMDNGTNSESGSDTTVKDSPTFSTSPKFPASIADLYAGSESEGDSDDSSNLIANVRNTLEDEEKPNRKHFHYKNALCYKKNNFKSKAQGSKRSSPNYSGNKDHCDIGTKCNKPSTLVSPKGLGDVGPNDDRSARERKRIEHFQKISQSRKNIGVLNNPKFMR